MRRLLFALECTWTHAVVSPLAVLSNTRSLRRRSSATDQALSGTGKAKALTALCMASGRRCSGDGVQWGARVRLPRDEWLPDVSWPQLAGPGKLLGSGSGLLRQGSPRGAPARLGGPRELS